MKKVIKINESQLHNIIKERIDWMGKWIPDKESPFDKAKEYSLKKDLIKELLEIIKKYRNSLKDEIIEDAMDYVIKKHLIK
jgi:hypothetical protein